MKKRSLKIFAAAFVFIAATVAAFFLLSGAKEKGDDGSASKKTVTRLSGYTVIVSEDEQRTGGITTTPLKTGLYQQKLTAYGEVLAPDRLSDLYNGYIAASSALERARAQVKASGAEYARLKVLNGDKNVSDKELEAAAARFKADQADAKAASGNLISAKNAVSLKWGPTISGWVFGYKPVLRRVFETKDVLVQITVPPSLSFKGIPQRVRITTPAGASTSARFVSRATSTNPALQGLSFVYLAPSQNGTLLPGMNVAAQLPSAVVQRGVVIPASAVVWMQDRAWAYVKKSETGFSRVDVPTSTPVENGYFVSGVFSSGDLVVTRGAQALLSAESTPKAPSGGGEDEEDGD